ncbi:MAG TPA: AGE family epimerase/isomerase [Bacteroidota bacterium]|nr:AGE family epimerase/isomerase [Bacteroidota bacterium]
MMPDFRNLERQYRNALVDDVLPFWEKHSLDTRDGGFFSSLARDGTVYDTEKFIWPQCRQLWLYSMLCTRLEKRENWLRVAEHGYRFLRSHGRDGEGNWYFALMRDGTPLVQPYNIFSDCFAAMAFSRYAEASGDGEAGRIALNTYRNILARIENPKGKYSKIVPGSRPLRAFAIPMILINLVPEMEQLLPPEEVRDTIGRCVRDMTGLFLDSSRGIFFEQMAPDGSHVDCAEGRLINPGHGIEGTWFLMDAAGRTGDRNLIGRAVDTLLATLRFGWDGEYGGIFAFLDAEGKPPQQLEWDQKFWWVHIEALVALAMGYRLTRRDDCLEWLVRVHEYTWSHFPDPEYGEWFGYLDRRGAVLTPLKGGKWKGCFHIPRGLFLCAEQFRLCAGA